VAGHRLLVVDDEPSIRFALREYFTAQGWSVTCVTTVEQSKEALAQAGFDVAILDLCLDFDTPDGGLEVASFIARHYSGIRTILLTGYGSPQTRSKALEIGVAEVLDKPVRLPGLCELACRLAERNSLGTDVACHDSPSGER
jgi:DNA-binding NtrC family response regulator